LENIWLLVGISALAGSVSGITGFGFGLVSMGVLVTVMPVPQASVIVGVMSLCVSLLNLWTVRRSFDWHDSWPPTLAGMIAAVGGVYLLTALDAGVLRVGVAAMIIAGCVVMLWSPKQARTERAWPWGYLLGFVGGIFGGALGMGGPPMVLYTFMRRWDKGVCKAVLAVFFTATNSWRLILLAARGVATGSMLEQGLLVFIPGILATYLGTLVFARMSNPVFRNVTAVFMVALAIKLVIS
jgi:hypothetical protein